MREEVSLALIGALCVGLLSFCAADITRGEGKYVDGAVVGHEYHPPYTTMSCDDKGHCSTTHHSARHILIVAFEGEHSEMNVKRSTYHAVKDGEKVGVTYTKGRYTGIRWGSEIKLPTESYVR